MRRTVVVWVVLLGGWVFVIGAGLFGAVLPPYENVVVTVVADRVLADTTSTLESVPDDVTMTEELVVPDTLRGARYHLGIEAGDAYIDVPDHNVESTVSLKASSTVTYADSMCQSGEGVRVVVTPTENTTIVSLCGGE